MAAKKRSAKASRKSKPRQVTNKRWLIFSAAAGSLFNMTVTAVTSGSVLLCFSQLSDSYDERRAMIMNYLPLISATVVLLVILAFAAEASSQ